MGYGPNRIIERDLWFTKVSWISYGPIRPIRVRMNHSRPKWPNMFLIYVLGPIRIQLGFLSPIRLNWVLIGPLGPIRKF